MYQEGFYITICLYYNNRRTNFDQQSIYSLSNPNDAPSHLRSPKQPGMLKKLHAINNEGLEARHNCIEKDVCVV